nr:glycoside hydrolase family 2 TIM barrel-domain containing protein [Mediterraneibacter gnavus]
MGFRTICIEDGIIKLNGRRLIINGVNRHEWNAKSGRCISENDEIYDIECMKRNNINAVRTCHYPDRTTWYYRCDEAGIYVMAEVNLESHGSWQKMGAVEPSWNVPGSVELWQDVVLDRVKSNFEMFKNHTSVLFWSLGNESYAGEVLKEMNAYYKKRDPGRLVHYEGVFQNRDYEDNISDVESQMYAPPGRVREYLENEPKKPFILCEYMHDMGNSLGGMKSYIDLLDQYEKYQGGFIWDYIDQALLVKDEITGREVLRYGGDFDDRPSDYEFSGNGIVFADRTEKPAMQEVKYYYGLQK